MKTKRIPIFVRGLISSAIGLLSTAVIALGFIVTISSLEQQSLLVQQANEASRKVEDILLNSTRGEAAFITTVSFVGAKMEPARITETQKKLSDTQEHIKQLLAALDERTPGLSRESLHKITADFTDYQKSTTEVVGLLDIDISLANMQMLDAVEKASVLEIDLVAAKSAVDKARTETESTSLATTKQILQYILYLVIALGVISLWVSFVVSRSITRPIISLTHVVDALTKGDLEIEIKDTDRQDELGDVIRAISIFKDNAIETNRLSIESAKAHAAKEARQERIEEYISLFQKEVTTSMGQMDAASEEMRITAGSMSKTAQETSQKSCAVAAASEEASASVSTVASAAEELSASVVEIARQTNESQKTADQAVTQANTTESTVRELESATNKISDVMNLINNIASQTNLLALNATIEAARAGDAGKGFAVVASEVKNLAGQTAKATDEVAAQITSMQNATKGVAGAISMIGTTISQMNKMAAAISQVVEQQNAAVQEIARNAQQASVGTQDVSSNITGVNVAVESTGTEATHVLKTAGDLSKQSEYLRAEISDFLNKIRTA